MAKLFKRNWEAKYEIGKEEEDASFVELGSGIKEVAQSVEEESEQIGYHDLDGGKETIFEGVTGIYVFTGDRDYGDEAQNMIRAKLYNQEDRGIYLKVTEADGVVVEGFATVGEIVTGGGESTKRGAFECTIRFVGKPKETPVV